jgi:uncharacterized protein (TIGR02391 family)
LPNLAALVPDVDILLALEPAELAPYVLEAIKSQISANGHFHEGNGILYGLFPGLSGGGAYPAGKEAAVAQAVAEAVGWLKANLLLITAPGNSNPGNLVLSRQAAKLNSGSFPNFIAATTFPKSLLHPSIADDVWLNLVRGDLGIAVFIAFRAVEEKVRSAGGYAATDLGVDLMRRAFDADKGPLTKASDPTSERQALAHLFAGAIGSYKNNHSHRTVTIADTREAQEMVMLASHLLRIVDDRSAETP